MIVSLLMNSSTGTAHENLAPKLRVPKLILGLKDLANTQDNGASFEWFARRWPVFSVLNEDPADAFGATAGRINYAGFSYGEPWTRMPPNLPKKFFLMWQMREALREIWQGNSDKLTEVLLPSLDEIFADPDPEGLWPPQLKVNWQTGEFVYKPRSEFQGAVHELFRRSPFVKVCANPACPAPYFIAHKTAQRYCEEACAEVFQREWKRRWWKEKGTKWRSKRSRGKREKA
jgi:hypothetical protein